MKATWFKSSYSGSQGGDCLEARYNWRKSSHSSDEGGNCVEVATRPATIHIRDSKATPTSPIVTVSPATWHEFVGGLGEV
ncbi:DUF397 domain-containing protein [Streptomyces sp. LP11]|uniref:DUF397 domain-containing protein n=1 Tax=Streptomyces pyxinicus TaxID=2970331 RepID=A0ABT2B6D4_9ACTN|nr:DUF397 domain-containing protein [Streptomyces sp. LP11]MCS0604069.1 DUF397 domain-containing protein [Streptomyces sp. LP11]